MGPVRAQAVGGPVDADHGGAVKEPVEHRSGNGRVAESAGPVGNTDIGREDRARLLPISPTFLTTAGSHPA